MQQPSPMPSPGSGFLVLASMTAASALVGASMYIMPVLAPTMAPAFGVSSLAVGHYVSLIYAGSIMGGALGGDLVTRLGPVRVHQASLLACITGMLLMLTGSLSLAALSALLVGIGSGATTPASSQLIRRTTAAERMNLAFSIRQSGLPLGGVLAGVLAPEVQAHLDWHGALIGLALLSLPFVLLLQPLRRELDDERQRGHPIRLSAFTSLPAAMRETPGLGQLTFVSVAFATAQLALSSYFVTYLHERFGYTLLAAGALLSVIHGAGIVARLSWGYAADRWLGAPSAMRLMATATGVAFIVLGLLGPGTMTWVLALLAAVLGACSMGWNGLFLSEVARRAPPGAAARTMSAILPITFGGALIGPPLFAAVVAATGSYGAAFIFVALLPLAGAVAMLRRRA